MAAKPSVLCCHLENTNEQFCLLLNYFGPYITMAAILIGQITGIARLSVSLSVFYKLLTCNQKATWCECPLPGRSSRCASCQLKSSKSKISYRTSGDTHGDSELTTKQERLHIVVSGSVPDPLFKAWPFNYPTKVSNILTSVDADNGQKRADDTLSNNKNR